MGLTTVGVLLLILPLVTGSFPKYAHKSPSALKVNPKPNIDVTIGNKTRLPHNLVAFQYDIQIQPYFQAPGVTFDSSKDQTFDGFTRVQFQMLESAYSVALDVYNLTIMSAVLYKGSTRQQLVSADYDNSANRITLVPVFFLQPNQNYTIEMTYSGKIMDDVSGGLYRSIYTFPNGTQGAVYATHFETFPDQYGYYDPLIGSSRVFPSFDDPHFKAVFNLTLIYPSSLVAIANTLDVGTQSLGNGWSQTIFELTNKQSSYLVAFSIGDLVSKKDTMDDGFIVRAWSWRGTENGLDYAVVQTKICVDAMTKFTGIKLPFKKLDILAVPHFSAGGMENWGLIINEAQFVLYDPIQDSLYSKIGTVDVNCHEIAHQWFGDLVTNDWWSDIMLHESFAAYFEDYLITHGWPDQRLFWDTYFIASSIESGLNYDTFDSQPIIVDTGMFEGGVYVKGSALLRMLESTIGSDTYKQGLQNYLNKYKFSTADHEMLFAVLTETVNKNPNIVDWCNKTLNVTTFMDPWFEQPHFPVLSVSYDPITNSYNIEQQPFVYYYNYTWAVPFHAQQLGSSSSNLYWSGPSCDGQGSTSTVQIPSTSDKPLLVNFDTNTFARVQYDDYSFQQILNALDAGGDTFTDNSIVRLILDELAIVQRNKNIGQPASYLRTLKIFALALRNNGTNSGGIIFAAQKLINTMTTLGLDSYERDLFNLYFNNMLTPLYIRTGWKQSDTENWNLDILQHFLLPYAVRFNLGDARSKATSQFSNLISKCSGSSDFIICNNVPISLRPAVYCGAAISGGSKTFEILVQFLKSARTSYSFQNSEVSALISGMACTQDQKSIGKFLDYAFLTPNLSPSDLTQLQMNPLASDILYDYILKKYASVAYSPNGLYYGLQAMTANWISKGRVDQLTSLRQSLDSQLTDQDKKVFDQVLSSVSNRSPVAIADRAEIVRHFYDQYAPIGAIPWTKRLPQGVIVPQNYQLSVLPYIPNKSFIYPSEKNFTYDANVTMTLKTLADLQKITLNSHRQVISSVSVTVLDSLPEVIPVTSLDRDYNNAIMTLSLGTIISAGSLVRISFSYSGFIFEETPNEGLLSNYEYLQSDGRKHWIFATDFEGGPSTRSLAICVDEPSYKATWQVTITYPGEFTALSNTLEQSITNLENGLVQTVFKETNLMSSYLLALTIGHYSCLQDVSTVDRTLVRIWTWTGMEQYGQKALEFAVATVDYLSKTLKRPMPLEKFDVLALPQYSGSAYGAMENWGLVIAGYREVLYHPDYSFTEELTDIQNTVSHELTHHWFGDLVTMDWWTHLFLNEGFATYWPPRTLGATLSNQSAISNLYIFDIHQRALQLDDYPNSANPVVPDDTLIGTPGYRIFSQSVYDKAASIIGTLKNVYTNDSIFVEALQNYFQAHALGNAEDLDLWKSMDSIAQTYKIKGWTGSIFSATTMMLPYTRQFSAPQISIGASGNGYSLAQSPLVDPSQLPNSSYNYQWIVPFKTLTPGSKVSEVQWLATTSGSLPSSNGPLILNPGAETHARVLYDDAAWAPIYTTLKQSPESIDEITRAQLLTDAWAFIKTKKISWERFLNHTTYLANENGFLPWNYALTTNGFIKTLLYNFRFHKVFANLKLYLKGISSNLKLGNFVRGDDWSQNILNSLALEFRCSIGDTSCLVSASSSFKKFITQCQYASEGTGKCNPASPEFRETQLCYGLRQNGGSFDALKGLADWWRNNPASNSYFPQDSQSIIRGLSCSNDVTSINNLINATLNYQFSPDFLYNLGDNDIDGTTLYKYLSSNTASVVNSEFFPDYMDAMTTSWGTEDQLNLIKNFKWPTLSANQQRVIDGAVQKITNLKNWLSNDGSIIQKWIDNYVSSG